MRLLLTLLFIFLAGCATQTSVGPKTEHAQRSQLPSLEKIGAAPDITCEPRSDSGCAAQRNVAPKSEHALKPQVLSLEEISAAPDITCDPRSDARRMVRVRQIAVEAFPRDTAFVKAATPGELRAAYRRLLVARAGLIAGESFEAIWAKYSDPQTSGGRPDGDIGYFRRGELVPEVERVAFCIPVGEISPVFRSVFGFHVIQVTDVRY